DLSNPGPGLGEPRWAKATAQGARAGTQPQEAAGEMMSAVKDKVQNMASTVADKAQEAWDSTKQGVSQAATTVAHTAEDAFTSLTGCMSRWPLATFFTGIGVGVALA